MAKSRKLPTYSGWLGGVQHSKNLKMLGIFKYEPKVVRKPIAEVIRSLVSSVQKHGLEKGERGGG